MSEELRNKHARRIEQKQRHIKRQVNIAKNHAVDVSEPHRFAKHNAMDCGIPHCPLCSNPRHNATVKQKMTMQEVKSILKMKDRED